MGKGSILEEGTHDELVAKNGPYKKLVERQLMKEELKKIDEKLN